MNFRYGKQVVDIKLPSTCFVKELEKPSSEIHESESTILERAIDELLAALRVRLAPKARLLIIVPDHTRKCNLPFILPRLTHALEKAFQPNIEFLIANGSHVALSKETLAALLSPEIYSRYRVTQHDAKDESRLIDLGTTTFGTPIRLNRKVRETDFIITVNGILYHYFAGFGGGAKMLLPGVAGYETIRCNHSLSIDPNYGFHPNCREGNLADNPVFQDLRQVLNFVNNALSLQVVLAPEGRLAAAAGGNILEAQARLLPIVQQLYGLPLEEQADWVIADAGGFPGDVNLIQAHKAIHHAFRTVKRGGALIMIAECGEGIGSQTFLPTFDYGDSRTMAAALSRNFQINSQTALALKEKTENAKIYLLSNLDPEIVKKTGMIPLKRPTEIVALVEKEASAGKTGIVFRQANLYLPLLAVSS
ncbi:MAG: nickel-dependent lactate racemase [candidate division KSB1 bacterium]|nr:nickel-dependent lactate racemase [candidate division KSB1 bacterium]